MNTRSKIVQATNPHRSKVNRISFIPIKNNSSKGVIQPPEQSGTLATRNKACSFFPRAVLHDSNAKERESVARWSSSGRFRVDETRRGLRVHVVPGPGQDAMNGAPGKHTGTYRIDNDNDDNGDNDDDKGTLLLNGQTRTSLTMALAPFEMPALISRLKTSSRLVAALSPSSLSCHRRLFYYGRNRVSRSIDRIDRCTVSDDLLLFDTGETIARILGSLAMIRLMRSGR